jgi:hypothetical protein
LGGLRRRLKIPDENDVTVVPDYRWIPGFAHNEVTGESGPED